MPWLPKLVHNPTNHCLAHKIWTTPLTGHKDAESRYKCTVWYQLHFTLLGLGFIEYSRHKLSFFLRGTKMDLIGFDSIAMRLKRHQQMVSISDFRFQHSCTSLLHRLPLSRIPFADDGIPNESDGISGESEPHSDQISRRTVTDEVASSIWPIHCHQLDQLLLHCSLPFF